MLTIMRDLGDSHRELYRNCLFVFLDRNIATSLSGHIYLRWKDKLFQVTRKLSLYGVRNFATNVLKTLKFSYQFTLCIVQVSKRRSSDRCEMYQKIESTRLI
jgi:hypothetical protein